MKKIRLDTEKAHRYSAKNRSALKNDLICGCFYCLNIFSPVEIIEWIEGAGEDDTALCPQCGVDSVIGESSGFDMTEKFFQQMNKNWFDNTQIITQSTTAQTLSEFENYGELLFEKQTFNN